MNTTFAFYGEHNEDVFDLNIKEKNSPMKFTTFDEKFNEIFIMEIPAPEKGWTDNMQARNHIEKFIDVNIYEYLNAYTGENLQATTEH